LCSNFSIFKNKSAEEVAEDGEANGNKKLVPVVARHGGGLDDSAYINCHMKGYCAKITEGKTQGEVLRDKASTNEGFVMEEGNGEDIPFE
jgi:hypothetical protein